MKFDAADNIGDRPDSVNERRAECRSEGFLPVAQDIFCDNCIWILDSVYLQQRQKAIAQYSLGRNFILPYGK
jgi:hypothetical protein